MYAYFGNFSCPNSTKMAKITWPVSMATRFKSHNSGTGFWLFALKDTSCANFIKIGDYRFPRPFGPYRELILIFKVLLLIFFQVQRTHHGDAMYNVLQIIENLYVCSQKITSRPCSRGCTWDNVNQYYIWQNLCIYMKHVYFKTFYLRYVQNEYILDKKRNDTQVPPVIPMENKLK